MKKNEDITEIYSIEHDESLPDLESLSTEKEKTNSKAKGTLYLIPSLLGEADQLFSIPAGVRETASSLNEFIVEEPKSARHFLRALDPERKLQGIIMHTVNKHTPKEELPPMINRLLKGNDIGIISEAGVPCVADPGSLIVALAHQHNIRVKPLVGPSSILLALMASGFNGQGFAFHGYLPIDKKDRSRKLNQLEQESSKLDQTQIFIETPYRNTQMLSDLVTSCSPDTRLAIAANLTLPDEIIISQPIRKWKQQKINLNKKPAVFLLYHA